MFSHSDEIKCQYDVLKIISNGNDQLVNELILYHNMILTVTFRNIITEYENKFNRVPSSDELIWISSEKMGENIRDII